MNGPTKKILTLREIAAILGADVRDVQCLDRLTVEELKKIKRVAQIAIDKAHED